MPTETGSTIEGFPVASPAALAAIGDRVPPPRSNGYWLPGLRLPLSMRRSVRRIAGLGSPLCRGWRWLPTAVVVGVIPFLISLALSVPGHQAVTACVLAFLVLSCAQEGARFKGLALISITFISHSVVIVIASASDAPRVSPILPGAEEYWQKQVTWITTGKDAEYELANWVPAHFQLFGGSSIYSYTSLGSLTFYEGFNEVDLMNYYNGRLASGSISPPRALAFGWHFWSVLRGIGYLFITFELISLSLQQMTGVLLATWRERACHLSIGIALLVADGLGKYFMLESVRSQLQDNLQPAGEPVDAAEAEHLALR